MIFFKSIKHLQKDNQAEHCDGVRPCSRCVRLGVPHMCIGIDLGSMPSVAPSILFVLLFCIRSVIYFIDKSGASCDADAPGSCSATPAGCYCVRGVGRPIRWAAVSEAPRSRGTIVSHYAIASGAASALSSAQYAYGRADAHCPTSQWECEPHARRRPCSQRGTLNCAISVMLDALV
jgi:hypothetical protein